MARPLESSVFASITSQRVPHFFAPFAQKWDSTPADTTSILHCAAAAQRRTTRIHSNCLLSRTK